MDVKVRIPCWGKDVLVHVPDGSDPQKAFKKASEIVKEMFDKDKIADPECSIKPPNATHKVVKQPDGQYRLRSI